MPARIVILVCVLLSAACESEQDLGRECLPLDDDMGAAGTGNSGCPGDAVVMGMPGVLVDASSCPSSDASSTIGPFGGRPLGAINVGRLAGCTDTQPACGEDGGACFNPFYSSVTDAGTDAGRPSLQDLYGPCACELPAD